MSCSRPCLHHPCLPLSYWPKPLAFRQSPDTSCHVSASVVSTCTADMLPVCKYMLGGRVSQLAAGDSLPCTMSRTWNFTNATDPTQELEVACSSPLAAASVSPAGLVPCSSTPQAINVISTPIDGVQCPTTINLTASGEFFCDQGPCSLHA